MKRAVGILSGILAGAAILLGIVLLLTALAATCVALGGAGFGLMTAKETSGEFVLGGTFLFLAAAGLFLLIEGTAAGFFAAMLQRMPRSVLPHLLPVAAYAIAFFEMRGLVGRWMPVEAIGAVLFYISGFLLCKAKERGAGKTEAVLWASIPAVVLSAGILVYMILMHTGLTKTFFFDFIKEQQDRWAQAAEDYARSLLAVWNAGGGLRGLFVSLGYIPQTVTDEDLTAYYAEYLQEMMNTVLVYIPSLLIAACNIGGYIAASMTAFADKRAGKTEKWRLTASLPALLIFLAAALVNAFVYPLIGMNIFVLIMLNLFVVYLPQMVALGMQTLTGFTKKSISEHKIMFILLMVLLVFNPLLTLSGIGVYSKLMERLARRIARSNGGGPDGV